VWPISACGSPLPVEGEQRESALQPAARCAFCREMCTYVVNRAEHVLDTEQEPAFVVAVMNCQFLQ
jgi:hypothetical protein